MKLPFLFDESLLTSLGWTVQDNVGSLYSYVNTKDPERRHLVLLHEADKIKIIVNYDTKEIKKASYADFSGHTHFELDGKWTTFDRYGVEDSFYVSAGGDLNVKVNEQLKRISGRRTEVADAGGFISLPQVGFRVTRKWVEAAIATLRSGKTVSLSPSGFGTGYTLFSKLAGRRRWGARTASEELCRVLAPTGERIFFITQEMD
jgi:hypothetical protein